MKNSPSLTRVRKMNLIFVSLGIFLFTRCNLTESFLIRQDLVCAEGHQSKQAGRSTCDQQCRRAAAQRLSGHFSTSISLICDVFLCFTPSQRSSRAASVPNLDGRNLMIWRFSMEGSQWLRLIQLNHSQWLVLVEAITHWLTESLTKYTTDWLSLWTTV